MCVLSFFFFNFLVFALNVFVGQHRRRRTGKGEHFRERKRRRLHINVPDCFGWSSSSKRIGEIKKRGNMQSQREREQQQRKFFFVLDFIFLFGRCMLAVLAFHGLAMWTQMIIITTRKAELYKQKQTTTTTKANPFEIASKSDVSGEGE